MDRLQILLVGLPLFLFCSDLVNFFTPPPKPHHHQQAHHHHHIPSVLKATPDSNHRGTAVTMKRMLETSFPGIDVILANHPPTLPKRLLSKAVPVFQVGVIGLVMAGEQIFPRLGFMTPPPWYFSMRANRFGTIASTWLLGNFLQSFLQSSGAFEVYCNDELVFSKLKEHRFPSEYELRSLVNSRLANTRIADGLGGALW